MQIDRIRITNFKSIPELDINFQEINGLWEISGVVGSGKTTIGEAIIFALFGAVRGKTNESLISWGKKHALVEAWVYTKNRHLYIRREINAYGQSPLTATIENEEILGSDKRSIQGILESEWYDISRPTLELLCIISFNNFKSLSTLNTSDSREFLNSTIAFDRIEQYEAYCKEQIKECDKNIIVAQNKLAENKGALKSLDDVTPQKPKYSNLQEITGLWSKKKAEWDAKKEEFQKHHRELIDASNDISNKHKAASVTLKSIKDNYKKLKGGICPLCGNPVTPEHLEEMENEIKEREELVEHTKLTLDLRAKKSIEYDGKMHAVLEKLEDEHSILKWEMMKTQDYSKQLAAIEKKKDDHRKEIKNYEDVIENLNKEKIDWQEMLDFIRDQVRPTIISSIIPNINRYIQYYMSLAHQNYVVYFDDTFKCMMKNPFNETIPVSSLSTGQKKVIDMIIILAFIKTFITQIDFNVYFMDELIGNIDADLRDTMCSLLRGTIEDKDVMFLISHSPINQQYLDGVIKVTRTAGISEYSIINISK